MFGSLIPGRWKRLIASGLVVKATGQAMMTGLICTESSTLIVSLYDTATDDSDGAAELIAGPLTLVAGNPYPIPAIVTKGLYAKIVSGSGSFTVFYN